MLFMGPGPFVSLDVRTLDKGAFPFAFPDQRTGRHTRRWHVPRSKAGDRGAIPFVDLQSRWERGFPIFYNEREFTGQGFPLKETKPSWW